jgi:ectoine hydroxylase-related dioxygenase (phytanoyl-CoA dioxygenase family)
MLPPEDIAAYRRDGILAPYPVLSEPDRLAALATIALIDAQPPAIRKSLLLHKTHLASATLARICALPSILDRVESLIGPDILVWGANFFLKEPHSPAYVSWHQDATYWGLEPADIVTAWVALTPSTRESGCLRVVPGSHLWPIVQHVETYASDNLLSRGQEIAVDVDPADVRDIPLSPGEMSLHHVKIAHNSEPNAAPHRRIGFAIRYVAAHVKPAEPDTAMPVRGTTQGHFIPEPGAAGELTPEDLARHAASHAGNRIAPKRPGLAES